MRVPPSLPRGRSAAAYGGRSGKLSLRMAGGAKMSGRAKYSFEEARKYARSFGFSTQVHRIGGIPALSEVLRGLRKNSYSGTAFVTLNPKL